MARIDRSRLEGAQFPMVEKIATRFDDLDVQGHVNNAAAVVILQEGRVLFNRAAGLPWAMGNLRAMVVGLTVEYAAEMTHPEPVELGVGILDLGRSSFTMGQVIRQGGRTAIYAEVAMVMANEAGAAPIPDTLRAAFEQLRIVPAMAQG